MLSNDGHFAIQHDAPLLAWAACLCLLASLAAMRLFAHARSPTGSYRVGWITMAALAGGVGIWATHFFAMLGFITGLSSGYDPALMALGMLAAVLASGAAFTLARAGGRGRALAAGAVMGLGIVAMHACGMAAYEVAGEVEWDHRTVALAVALALGLPMGAFGFAAKDKPADRFAAAALLAAAICAHHFTALGAVSIGMDPGAAVSPWALPPPLLVLPVALASLLILLLAAVALLADLGARRRVAAEARHMASLADAAVEGLMICDGGGIVTGNASLSALSGFASAEIAGMPLSRLLPDAAARDSLAHDPDRPVETHLRRADGEAVPVELHVHWIEFAGKPHRAFALRDLRARRLAESRIHFLAHHDGLTGLPNRALFDASLDAAVAEAARRGDGFAVLCLDLDRFKEINDLFGHHAGDETLKAVARVLSGISRGGASRPGWGATSSPSSFRTPRSARGPSRSPPRSWPA